MGDSDDDGFKTIRNVWIILNTMLVSYALFLLCYRKIFKQKDPLSLVINNLFNLN